MRIEFDSTTNPKELRAIAAFALMLAGDIDVPSLSDDESKSVLTVTAPTSGTLKEGMPIIAPGILPPGSTLGFPSAPPVPVAAIPQPIAPNMGVPAPAVPAVNSTPNAPAQTNVLPFAPQPASAPAQSQVAAAEYDSAGLPWDVRIHQTGKNKKKDGTWKLRKSVDPLVAAQVVQELIARKLPTGSVAPTPNLPPVSLPLPNLPAQAAPLPHHQSQGMPTPQVPTTPFAPLTVGSGPLPPDVSAEARAAWGGAPPAQTVQLPPGTTHTGQLIGVPLPTVGWPAGQTWESHGSVSLPQANGVPGAAMVPTPGIPGTMPVHPPVPGAPGQPIVNAPAGAVPAAAAGQSVAAPSQYKQLIDKLTAATQNRTLDPRLVAPTVQRFGVPNMGMLSDPQYATVLPAISQEFDRLIAGGASQ